MIVSALEYVTYSQQESILKWQLILLINSAEASSLFVLYE
jgi:hypothetical protein